MANTDGARVRGVDRVLDILATLHAARAPLGIGEIARRLNAPRSTIYDLVSRLLSAGLLETYADESEVFFGRTLHFYASQYLNQDRHSRLALEELTRLTDMTGQTTQYTTLNADKFVIMHMRVGQRVFKISSDIGIPLPLPWTASGRLLLDHLGDEEILRFVPANDFVFPSGRKVDPVVFCHEVVKARRQGFFMTEGLVDEFINCLAVPVRDASNVTQGCVCIISAGGREHDERVEWLDATKASAERLRQRLFAVAPSRRNHDKQTVPM